MSILQAEQRPKIALVLSGGGARGGAHVGVLKVLEKNRIPIDMIVGTSMGSFVGGLYVSGKTPQEIDDMLTSTNWEEYIRSDFNRQDLPMRRKSVDYQYQGKLGVGINYDNKVVLPTGVLKREPMLLKFMELTSNTQDIKDFSKLSIPYKAVATDIKNGNAVILDSGSLADAIYASSSIPGGFQPIRIDGKDLVDGGVSANFPIEIAREMGADIIIAVDVSEDFSDKLQVNSYFVVMGQLVNILMRKNANASIDTLKDKDILITPNLKGFSGLDADKYEAIIQKGYEAGLQVEDKLKSLSLSLAEYEVYRQKHRQKHVYKAPIISEIKIINPTYLADESIRKRIHQALGQPLDENILRADLLHLYNMTIFDSVDYFVQKVDGKDVLFVKVEPSWDNHGEVRFAIGFEDDFKGHSAYTLKAGYTMFGINELGAEWKNDFEIGRYERVATEFFQPLDSMQRYYLRPSLMYESVTDVFPTSTIGNQEIFSSRYGATLSIGAHVHNTYEFEVGLSTFKDIVQVDALQFDKVYKAKPLYAHINIDTLDNVNFPKMGVKTKLKWTKEFKELGSDYNYEQIYFEIEKPFSFFANNITAFVKYGNTYKNDNVIRFAGKYSLGGLFNLSGYAPYSFNGDNVALAVLKYTYELKDGGFFGSLNAPLYAGFSLESGQAWDKGDAFTYDSVKKSATAYLAADTFLGPLYIAYGVSDDGHDSFYLYLGEKF